MQGNKIEGYILGTEEWSDRYQRNNKRSGVKNLRCFPCCSQPHHMEKGYCGRPVILSLKRTPYLDKVELFAWAEFKTVEEIPRVRVGSNLTTAEVKSLTRSRIDIYKPWYRGDIRTPEDRSRNEIHILFNTSKKGWNYNWAATRNSAMVNHVLICYVCILDDYQEGTFRCIATFESPQFTIYCRKQNGIPLASLKRTPNLNQESYYYDDDDDDDDEGLNVQPTHNEYSKLTLNPNDFQSKNQQYQGHQYPQAQLLQPKSYHPTQRHSQSQFATDLEFFNEVDGVVDSKVEPSINSQEGFDPIRSLFSASSMSNLFLPSSISTSAEQKYQSDSANSNSWLSSQPSSLATKQGFGSFTNSGAGKRAPILSTSRLSFGDEDAWKKLLSPPSFIPNSQNYNWNNTSSSNNGNNAHSQTNMAPSQHQNNYQTTNSSSAGYANVTGNKRKDFDTSSNGSSEEDIEKQIIRLCFVLDKLDAMLREKGAASKMGIPQFALEEFLQEIGNVGFDDEATGSLTPLTGSLVFNMSQIEPIVYDTDAKNNESGLNFELTNGVEATKLLEELMGFLLNESQVTASLKTFANSRKNSQSQASGDERIRKMEFINVFHKQLENYLASKGISFSELDELLQIPKKDAALASKALKKFEEHVRRYVEDEDMYEQRKRMRPSAPNNSSFSYNSLIPSNPSAKTIDLTGDWRLDDATLEAMDSLRAIRGLPWFLRQVLTFMEKKIIVEHLHDRLLVRLNRKLLSTGVLEYLLDNQVHDLISTGPLPWARPVVETYRAWIDGDTFRFIHCYDSNLRSVRAIRKNATGDRLEIIVNLQEKISPNVLGFNDEAQWKTIVEKSGYALRGPNLQ